MNILITGASSYVGASIYSRLKDKYQVHGTYMNNKLFPELDSLDITNRISVIDYVSRIKPDFIIHVAAYASGNWADKNLEKGLEINEKGTRNIVDAANNNGSKIIFISSFAALNASSPYGVSKSNGEQYVKETKAGYVILRPSLIVGLSPNTTNDRPFNRILKNITEHTPAAYDTSWKFQPTWLRHIDEVVEEVIIRQIVNETVELAVPEAKTRFDIANDLLSDMGIKVTPKDMHDISPLFVNDLKTLKELGLPQYTYDQMIEGIKQEIKEYLKKR